MLWLTTVSRRWGNPNQLLEQNHNVLFIRNGMSSPISPGFCGEIWRIASNDFCKHQPLMLTKCSQSAHKFCEHFVSVKFMCQSPTPFRSHGEWATMIARGRGAESFNLWPWGQPLWDPHATTTWPGPEANTALSVHTPTSPPLAPGEGENLDCKFPYARC
jgi:hypothetical protein